MITCDTDGVTDISLKNLEQLSHEKKLFGIYIKGNSFSDVETTFTFTDGSTYTASGFSVGYSGTGPRGLYSAMRFFVPNICDWQKLGIFKLSAEEDWLWNPEFSEKFIKVNYF